MNNYEIWRKTLTKEQEIGYKIMYHDLTYKQIYDRMIKRFGLILQPPLILTGKQMAMFKKNKSINPITKRKMKHRSKTYMKIEDAYKRSIKIP
jgi:hypothetical protein